MKWFKVLMGILVLTLSCSVSPITVNGRFYIIEYDGSKLSALIQINANSSGDDLGGTTLVFSFDTTAVSFPNNPTYEVDYSFHNFSDGNYSIATITKPMKNQIWINIDLPYTNNNNGTIVSASPNWTDVVTINFNVVDRSKPASLVWLTSSPFWGIYDADNSTLWEAGQFEDSPTSVELVTDRVPNNFELSQNYPNPFNPTTKIKYTVPFSKSNSFVPISVKVYDILGNEIATLVDQEKEPGVYEVEFSSTSVAVSLASGIYLYTIRSGEFIDTKKMILLK